MEEKTVVQNGDLATFVSRKGKYWVARVKEHDTLATHFGVVNFTDIIGKKRYGERVETSKGNELFVFRPALHEYVLKKMKRGAQIIYPKDASAIITYGDIRNGMRVLEAGTGSGAMTCFLVEAVSEKGFVLSVERRKDFLRIAKRNIEGFFSGMPSNLALVAGDVKEVSLRQKFDRAVLDLVDPWNVMDNVTEALVPGGVLVCYVTNVPQLQKTYEAMKRSGKYTDIKCMEVLVREWLVDEKRARPKERMVAHTGFIMVSRRVA